MTEPDGTMCDEDLGASGQTPDGGAGNGGDSGAAGDDGGAGGGDDAGANGETGSSGSGKTAGCGCVATGGGGSEGEAAIVLLLGALAAPALRRTTRRVRDR